MLFSVKLSRIAPRRRARRSRASAWRRTCGEKQVLDSFTSLSPRPWAGQKALSLYAIPNAIDSSCNPPWLLASRENERPRVSGEPWGRRRGGEGGKKEKSLSLQRRPANARYTSRRPEALISKNVGRAGWTTKRLRRLRNTSTALVPTPFPLISHAIGRAIN